MKIEVLNRFGNIKTVEIIDKVEIESLKKQGFFIISQKRNWGLKRKTELKSAQLAELFRDLAGLLEVGIPLGDAVKELSATTNKSFSKILEEISIKLSQGFFLYEIFQQIDGFPQEVLSSIQAGEKASLLQDTFKRLAEYYDKKARFAGKLKMALIYPVFVLIAIFVVSTLISIFVIPQLIAFYKTVPKLAPATKLFLDFSGALSHYWWVFPCILAGVFFILRAVVTTEAGIKTIEKISNTKAYLPLKERMFANFFSTLSMLVKNGVPLIDALEMVEIHSSVFRKSFQNIKESLTQGFSLSESMRKERIFPAFIIQSVTKGEKAALLYEYLERIAEYYWEKSDKNYQMFLEILGPVLICFVAIFVIFFIFAFLLPIYSNLTNVGGMTGL